MARCKVRYHRAILDESRRVIYPSGAIVELDKIPAGQHDRVRNLTPEEEAEEDAREALEAAKAKEAAEPA